MKPNIFAKDNDALRAIIALEGSMNPDWIIFKEALKRRVDRLDDDGREAVDEVFVRWTQGRTQELKSLLDSFSTARDIKHLNDTRRS